MKRLSCFLATVFLTAAALVLSTAVASAQTAYRPPSNHYPAARPPVAAARPAAGNIAVLDMTRVFKENVRFKALQEAMKADVQKIDASLKGENDTIRKMAEDLRDFKLGSPDYMNLDARITNRKAQLQANVQLRKKQLMLREADMFHSVYTEVSREVEAIANSRGLLMVVQYTKSKNDPNRPDSVMQDLNKQVVWHSKSIDITDEVIARVNRGGANYGTAARPTTGTARRPIR